MLDTKMQYSNVAALAKALDMPITIFDLECTAFRGRSNFGITEVYCFSVVPEGTAVVYGHLINPENAIDAKVVKLTGITPQMVANKETWGHRYAKLFQELAGTHLVGGFNVKTFDCPAVMDMNAKYQYPIETGFKHIIDVYQLYLKLKKPVSRKGNLSQVSQVYSVEPKGTLHRAQADVVLTVETLDAMIAEHGLLAILEAIGHPTRTTTLDSNLLAEIQSALASKASTTVEELANDLNQDIKSLTDVIITAVDAGKINPSPLANEATLAWLRDMLVEAPTDLLVGGKLKPLLEHLEPLQPKDVHLDSLQLRIGMRDAHVPWHQ